MKILRWLLIILVLLLLVILGFLWYMGVFSPIKASEREMGPYTIAYQRYVGEYKNTGKVFMDVYNVMRSLNMEVSDKSDSIGIYYDDPAKVAKDKLRSDCGIVIAAKDTVKITALAKKGIKIMTVRKKKCIVAPFPIRNMMSYMIGPAKGYPALMKYADEKKLKTGMMYEFYDMKSGMILFTMEVRK